MRKRRENGQTVLVVVIAIAVVLIGGIGLAIDSSQLYGQRQMAQVAADAAALSAIMSIFDRTNTVAPTFGLPPAPASSFTCTTLTDGRSPCKYARQNGFGNTSDDTVKVDFPTSATGVTLSGDYPVNVVHVLITRTVSNWFIKLVGGPATTGVKAAATAAIVDVVSPVPILVLHPTNNGSFDINGNPGITICGGPSRSIQVNSSSLTSITISGGSNTVDLSHAGPLDPGDCSAGTGADFGDFGGPAAYPSTLLLGTRPGKYMQPSSPIWDPLLSITPPPLPSNHAANTPLANGANGCPASPLKPCTLYHPGNYAGGISVKNETAVFLPGIYYMSGGGFSNKANGEMFMAAGVPNDPATGWSCTTQATCHMMIYNTGTGVLDVGSNSSAILNGSPAGSAYKSILFFQSRSAPAQTHSLGGGGDIFLTGTLYMTNTVATMTSTPAHYQGLSLQGNPGSKVKIVGEIIVDTLHMGGTPNILMNLDPAATLHIPQVALVK